MIRANMEVMSLMCMVLKSFKFSMFYDFRYRQPGGLIKIDCKALSSISGITFIKTQHLSPLVQKYPAYGYYIKQFYVSCKQSYCEYKK